MIIILTVLLYILLWAVIKSTKYLLHPEVIVVGVFCLSSTVCTFNIASWGDVSPVTALTVFFCVFMFCIGCEVAMRSGRRVAAGRVKVAGKPAFNVRISAKMTVAVVLFMLAVTFFQYRRVLQYADDGVRGILNIIASARNNSYEVGSIDYGAILWQALYMCRALAYIYIYYLCHLIQYSRGGKALCILPVGIYFLQALLSTGRTELIYFIYAVLLLNYCASMSKNGWRASGNTKYILQVIVGFALFIAIFLVLSNLRSSGNLISRLNLYIGSSVSALDDYIAANGLSASAAYFGEYTQHFLYSVLQLFGLTGRDSVAVMPAVTMQNGMTTNIYTALMRYIHDFSVLGALIIMFAVGFIYSRLFRRCCITGKTGLGMIVYAYVSYPVVEMAIEERIFSTLLVARSLFCIIYMIIFYLLLCRKRTTNDVKSRTQRGGEAIKAA